MDEKINFTRKEMEENLPDYIFNRLSPDNIIKFEQSLPDYPDLIEEIKQVRVVFEKLEKIDFDKVAFDKLSDLPTRVNARLNKNINQQKIYSRKGKYLVPALAAAVLLALALPNFLTKNSKIFDVPKNNIQKTENLHSAAPSINPKPMISKDNSSILNTENKIKIKNNKINNPDLAKSTNNTDNVLSQTIILPTQSLMSLQSEDIPYVEEYITTQFNKFLGNIPVQSFKNSVINNKTYEQPINLYLETLDENDLELIIKEVQNVNFQS